MIVTVADAAKIVSSNKESNNLVTSPELDVRLAAASRLYDDFMLSTLIVGRAVESTDKSTVLDVAPIAVMSTTSVFSFVSIVNDAFAAVSKNNFSSEVAVGHGFNKSKQSIYS
eukprot:NODE_585_length_6408_cov_0.301950.p3 type:complete len:113 gc:universal NODE_585_length_6408_cov_0.301950:3468-3806(+)